MTPGYGVATSGIEVQRNLRIEGERLVASNRVEALRIVRQRGRISRSEIQKALGLSFPGVSLVVSHLLEKDLIVKSGSAGNGAGRKADLFEFNCRKGYVLGIDLGARKMRIAVADLGGSIVHKVEMPTLAYEGGPRVMERLLTLARATLEARGISRQNVLAVGVAAPGISERSTGKNLLSPFIPRWSDVPIHATLENEFHVPVIVENDVDMAIIGEKAWGAGKGCENLVFLNVAVGVAAAMIVDGRLIRGANGAAGEIGFILPDPTLERDQFSEEGSLESVISGPGIVRRFREASIEAMQATRGKQAVQAVRAAHPEQAAQAVRAPQAVEAVQAVQAVPAVQPAGGDAGQSTISCRKPVDPAGAGRPGNVQPSISILPPIGDMDAETVFALAQAGDERAREVIERTVRYLSITLTNLVAVVNPERVVLGGGVGLVLYSQKDAIRDFLARHVPFVPEIVQAQLGSDASVFGAVAAAIDAAILSLENELENGTLGNSTVPGV